jgi:hypothetical protein
LRSVVATVVEAFTAVVAAAFTVAVEAFAAVAGFGVVVRFAAEAFPVAEAGSAVAARSAVESGFVATELSAAAGFVVAAFAAGEAGVGAAGAGVGDSVLAGAGPIGNTPIQTDTLTILGGGLPTMTLTITPTILLPIIQIPTTGRILITVTEILSGQTQLRSPTTGPRRLQPTIHGLPRRTALSVLTP